MSSLPSALRPTLLKRPFWPSSSPCSILRLTAPLLIRSLKPSTNESPSCIFYSVIRSSRSFSTDSEKFFRASSCVSNTAACFLGCDELVGLAFERAIGYLISLILLIGLDQTTGDIGDDFVSEDCRWGLLLNAAWGEIRDWGLFGDIDVLKIWLDFRFYGWFLILDIWVRDVSL